MGASLFVVFSLIFIANTINSAALISGLAGSDRGAVIGGEVTEIVSAPSTAPKDSLLAQSAFAASAIDVADSYLDTDLESAPYDLRDPLITGWGSVLQSQNPITVPTPEPAPAPSAPAKPVQPYYTAGPYLDGYFIFPTTGYNRGKLHAYNAVDISRGSDCIEENIPVYAAASGVITAAYPTQSTARWANSGYGNNIILLHSNGVITRYAHLKAILISTGQFVNQGSVIAYMGGYPGNPGSGNSTGCHLHFEVRGAKNPFVR